MKKVVKNVLYLAGAVTYCIAGAKCFEKVFTKPVKPVKGAGIAKFVPNVENDTIDLMLLGNNARQSTIYSFGFDETIKLISELYNAVIVMAAGDKGSDLND